MLLDVGQGGDYGVGEFLGGGLAAQVAGHVLAFAVDLPESLLDAIGGESLRQCS